MILREGKKMDYSKNASRLKEAMAEKGIKAVELSALSGIGKSSISQYMKGSHWPDDNRKVGLIADILNVDPSWLMGFDVPKRKEEKKANTDSDNDYIQRMIEGLIRERYSGDLESFKSDLIEMIDKYSQLDNDDRKEIMNSVNYKIIKNRGNEDSA